MAVALRTIEGSRLSVATPVAVTLKSLIGDRTNVAVPAPDAFRILIGVLSNAGTAVPMRVVNVLEGVLTSVGIDVLTTALIMNTARTNETTDVSVALRTLPGARTRVVDAVAVADKVELTKEPVETGSGATLYPCRVRFSGTLCIGALLKP